MVDAQIAVDGPFEKVVLAIDKDGLDAEEGPCRRSRLGRGRAGKRGDQDAAGFGLPPGVDDRAAPFTHNFVVPHPCLGIDRLADTSQKAERGAVASGDRRVALAHQRADCRRCGVEDADLVLFDDLPETRAVRPGRHAFEHQRRRAVRKRTIDDVAVAGDPAHIGRAPVDVAILVVEDILVRHRGVDHVAAGGVQHALRLAGRPGGIQDEHRVFGVHLLRRAVGRGIRHRLVIPDVAPVDPADVTAGAAHDDDLVAVGTGFEGRIGVCFQRHRPAAAKALVGGDHHIGITVLDAAGERVGREAAEDDGMHGADARAGQHRDGGLRDHRHVDGDAVALLRALCFQHIGELADFLMQLGIADMPGIRRVVAFPDDGGLVAAAGEMPVKAVGGGVERAVAKPADVKVRLVIGDVADLAVGLDPVDPLAMLGPEGVGVGDGCIIHRLIAAIVDQRVGDGALARGKQSVLGHIHPPTRNAGAPQSSRFSGC